MTTEEEFQSPGEFAVEVLEDVLELSGFAEVKVEVEEEDDRIRLGVAPADEDDAALMVGRQGNTMAAYQFIVSRIVQREFEGRVRVSLDVAGYGQNRKTQLESLGERLASAAYKNNLEMRILGMNPADRRAVHMSLAERKKVKTWSESEGIARRLVISGPAKKSDES
jgi:spoIIIJ-associated protein